MCIDPSQQIPLACWRFRLFLETSGSNEETLKLLFLKLRGGNEDKDGRRLRL